MPGQTTDNQQLEDTVFQQFMIIKNKIILLGSKKTHNSLQYFYLFTQLFTPYMNNVTIKFIKNLSASILKVHNLIKKLPYPLEL